MLCTFYGGYCSLWPNRTARSLSRTWPSLLRAHNHIGGATAVPLHRKKCLLCSVLIYMVLVPSTSAVSLCDGRRAGRSRIDPHSAPLSKTLAANYVSKSTRQPHISSWSADDVFAFVLSTPHASMYAKVSCLRSLTGYLLLCHLFNHTYWRRWLDITYNSNFNMMYLSELLNPMHAGLRIKPPPQNAQVFCLLQHPRRIPISIPVPSSPFPLFFFRFTRVFLFSCSRQVSI